MKDAEFETILTKTLSDGRITRGERRAVAQLIEDEAPNHAVLARFRSRAFDVAREKIKGHEDQAVLAWLEDIVKLLIPDAPERRQVDVSFSPGEGPRNQIKGLIRHARRTLDICVFTITDNHISEDIINAHKRGVRIRIVTDDNKAMDRGSDVNMLGRAGIEVREDDSDPHMHHKYAIADSQVLLTGSYNWTRSAALYNQENVLVTDDPRAVRPYQAQFNTLWDAFGDAE